MKSIAGSELDLVQPALPVPGRELAERAVFLCNRDPADRHHGRDVDVVIGCLDNREARLWVNRCCWKVGTPWVDGGIQEISGVAKVFVPPDSACYECAMTENDYRLISLRYSCPLLKREDLLAMIAVESGHIQSHWASPYEKVGMEGMIEKLRSEKAAAESARDDAVRERDRLRETLAAFIREVGELQVYYAALLQPQEVGDGE